MEILIFLIWFCLVWIIPISLVVSAYVAHHNGRKLLVVYPLLAVSMLLFVTLSLMLIGPMFQGFFAGGDPEMGGNFTGRWTYAAMVTGYAVFGWMLCSVLLGRPIVPGRRLVDRQMEAK